jgi:hypothetical protein
MGAAVQACVRERYLGDVHPMHYVTPVRVGINGFGGGQSGEDVRLVRQRMGYTCRLADLAAIAGAHL